MGQNKLVNWGIFILLSFIWGSSFILMKYSRQELTATQIAGIRIFSAGLVFLPFAIFHLKDIPRNKLGYVLLTGVLGNLLPAFLFASAISNGLDSSLAAILNSLTPICVIVTGLLLFKSKISSQKFWGVMVGFIGLCILFAIKGIYFTNLKYALYVILGTFLYGINVNVVSRFLKGVHPVKAALVSLGFLTLPTAIILYLTGILDLSFDEQPLQLALGASIILGVVASAIATALFYVLVSRAGGLFASLVTYGIPLVAIIWGLIDGEDITVLQVGCLGIILGGVYLANK